jgi:hypothetical protein
MRATVCFTMTFVMTMTFVACTIMNDRHLPATGTRGGVDARVVDGKVVEDAAAPVSTDASTCDPTAPFVQFRPIAELNTLADEGVPRLSPDELSIYFQRDDFDGGAAIFLATRPDKEASFAVPPTQLFPEIPGARMAMASSNGLRLYFSSGVGFDDGYTLRLAERTTPTSPFGNVRVLFQNPANESFAMPFVVEEPSGPRLYFTHADFTADQTDLLSVALNPTGGVTGAPAAIPGVNSESIESDPTPSSDALELYFYSERGAEFGKGRIFVARRTAPGTVFGAPTAVTEIVKPVDGYTAPGYLSGDGCRLYYYQSDQPNDRGDLFVASRPRRGERP